MADPVPNPLAVREDSVVELRQYTLHPGRRDDLVELFDREFVETQEALGIHVLGQFRDLDDADRFVWLRGFADMPSRASGLAAFYGGPAWSAHREAANATMIDSDDVLLLRPAWTGAGVSFDARRRASAGTTRRPNGLLAITVLSLSAPAGQELVAIAHGCVTATLQAAAAEVVGCCVTEGAANNFPRLRVRKGEQVLVVAAMFADVAAHAAFVSSGAWQREVAPRISPFLVAQPRTLRLAPTARSALHA